MLPFGEYRPDIANHNGATSQLVSNVVPRADGYGPWKSFVPYSNAMPGATPNRGFFYARKSDGSVAAFAGTLNKLYRLNATTLLWEDVSGGTYSNLPTSYHWQFAQFGNFVIAVQPNVLPQVYDLTSSVTFANLGGSPPQASYVAVVGRFLVLSGLLSNPYRIQWSGLNATTTWTPGVNSSDFQEFPDGGIVRGVAGGEFGVIFQDGVIRRMVYAVGAPYVFQIDRIAEDKGLLAPYSLIRAGDKIFFLASQGFHGMMSTGIPEPIGKEKFDRAFFGDYDPASLQLIIGAADPEQSRVYWSYRSLTGASGLFDKLLCYDYGLGRASVVSLVGEYIATLSRPGFTLEGLNSVSPSIDALAFSLDDVALSALPKIAIFDNNHKLGFCTGANLEATLDTAEQTLDERRVRVKGLRPITDAATCYGAIGTRENMQDAVAYSDEQAVNGKGLCPANVSTRLARARLRIPAGVAWSFASGFEPARRAGDDPPSPHFARLRRTCPPQLQWEWRMTVGTLAPNEKDLYKIVNIVRQLAEGRNNAPEMSGDATQNAAGVVTIAGDTVTNAKLANMMQASAKGRAVGAGTGDPIDLSPAQLFEIVAAGSTKPTVRKFTSSTIYTPSSAAVTWCLCIVKAGGGSGGGSSAAPPVGGGGGEGGVAWKVVPVAFISGQSITVGAGGASIPAGTSSEGSTGGTSSIGTVVTATGGIGGTRGQFGGAGGLGGTVGAADWGMPGCCGACGSDSNGTFGFNSNGGGNGAGNLTAAGRANSGGGGGGGTAGSASGPGGSGIVVIIEFYD